MAVVCSVRVKVNQPPDSLSSEGHHSYHILIRSVDLVFGFIHLSAMTVDPWSSGTQTSALLGSALNHTSKASFFEDFLA